MDALSQQGIASGGKEGKTSAMVLKNEGAEAEYIPPNSCQRTIRMKKRPTPLKDDTVLHCSLVQVMAKYFLLPCALKMSTAFLVIGLSMPISCSPAKDLLFPRSV